MNWIYLLAAWTVVALVVQDIWGMLSSVVNVSRRLHQIPCANCQFFTGSYYLKCPVRPFDALTEEAIGCLDYYA